jgi:tubulin--tyrosine ligase-like protein 12
MGLPEDLHRKLFMKLKFEDYDLSQHVQIILEEETNQTDMMCIKEMKAESDVFLVDHAWTFRYQDAYSTLSSNQTLFERLEKITEKWTEKKDLETETENKEEEVKV